MHYLFIHDIILINKEAKHKSRLPASHEEFNDSGKKETKRIFKSQRA